MSRPKKCRRVENFPENTLYVPYNKKKCEFEEEVLNIEELEAMRLKDIVNLNQEECAEKMNVSRQTFQNIISSAREKVARALLEGKAINITGGDYVVNKCKLKCLGCKTIFDKDIYEDLYSCPSCGTEDVICDKKEKPCLH